LLAALAATFVFLALSLAPIGGTDYAKFAACRNEITSDCLTELGVELAMNDQSPPSYMHEVGMLAEMGRFEDAYSLQLSIEEAKERPAENVEDSVNRRLASRRISAAIRRGESLQSVVEQTPSVDPGVLYISARDLLGHSPYGQFTGLRRQPDDQTLIVASELATMIAAMAHNEPERPRISHLVYAAELQAVLGNRAEVIQLLEQIPPTEDPILSLSEDIMRLIGSETALRLYHNAGGSRPNILLTAASAEPDAARAITYLDEAYDAFSTRTPWPDFTWMERTVERSAELGYYYHALQLAQDMAQKAQTEPSSFPVFPHIHASRALLLARADEVEVRHSLTLAESHFPKSDGEVVGIGFVSGLMRWGNSGLDAQARREMANLRARLGDVEAAIALMEDIEEPKIAWSSMLTSDISIEDLNLLLSAAKGALSTEGYSLVRAQLASEMTRTGKSEAQMSWGHATAIEILQSEQLEGDRAVIIYTILARVGDKLEDSAAESLALTRMAQAALNSRDYGDLISAGFHWRQSEFTP